MKRVNTNKATAIGKTAKIAADSETMTLKTMRVTLRGYYTLGVPTQGAHGLRRVVRLEESMDEHRGRVLGWDSSMGGVKTAVVKFANLGHGVSAAGELLDMRPTWYHVIRGELSNDDKNIFAKLRAAAKHIRPTGSIRERNANHE